MAFVENDHHMAVINGMALVGGDEGAEFLDRSDDDPSIRILQLRFQHLR